MSSKDDRLRIQHMRIENEKHYLKQRKMLEADLGDKFTSLSKQEDIIRKQHERLENEKQYNKSYSHLLKEQKLPAQENDAKKGSQSATFKEVKSKLFDYAKSSPRSRRQLIESGKSTPISPTPRGGLATHAIEGNKTSHRDIVHHLSLHSGRSSNLGKGRSPILTPTALEVEASRRSVFQPEHKITFTDDSLGKGIHHVNTTEDTGLNMAIKYKRRHTEPAPLIHVIDVNPDDVSDGEDDTVKLQDLYNKAIETVKQADESLLCDSSQKIRPQKDKHFSDPKSKSGFDVNALKELEHILNDARNYSSRKGSKEDHSRLDLGSNRAQKKRIEHLEQVLKQLDPKYGDSKKEMDPFQVLQCSYLRLSKSNIETLEDMIRHEGKEPGIHIHSDVTDYDIWEHIKQERAGQNQQS